MRTTSSRDARTPVRLRTSSQYVRHPPGRLESGSVPRLNVGPDEPLSVLVPSHTLAAAVEELSPRVRAHRVDPADGPPTGDAAGAQVWVPRAGGAEVPD